MLQKTTLDSAIKLVACSNLEFVISPQRRRPNRLFGSDSFFFDFKFYIVVPLRLPNITAVWSLLVSAHSGCTSLTGTYSSKLKVPLCDYKAFFAISQGTYQPSATSQQGFHNDLTTSLSFCAADAAHQPESFFQSLPCNAGLYP